jgi:cytoskeletal protein CcmA (bactofilin family)
MSDDKNKKGVQPAPEERRGLFGRFSNRFDEALQTNRAPERPAATPAAPAPAAAPREEARPKGAGPVRMLIPEGVEIEGNIKGACDTEIGGKINGDILINGRVMLNAGSVIKGNVRSASCRIDGTVEGRVECSDEVELGKGGRLNADVKAGKRINVAGQVYGNVNSPGVVHMAAGSLVQGDVVARSFMMEDGAMLNGKCTMRSTPPVQNGGGNPNAAGGAQQHHPNGGNAPNNKDKKN